MFLPIDLKLDCWFVRIGQGSMPSVSCTLHSVSHVSVYPVMCTNIWDLKLLILYLKDWLVDVLSVWVWPSCYSSACILLGWSFLLMLADFQSTRTTMSDDGDRTCPLCAEEMDITDQQLKPCKCGYDVCLPILLLSYHIDQIAACLACAVRHHLIITAT